MEVLLSITLFVVVGTAFVFANLGLGRLARPRVPNAQKEEAYECGEPVLGPSWVQFDLRFYTVALVFLVFDVEVALFYPWAVAYGSAAELAARVGATVAEVRAAALVDMLVFFGVLLVGFAYLWRFGYLDWVRSTATTSVRITSTRANDELSRLARIDPELELARINSQVSGSRAEGPGVAVRQTSVP
jgi:NADH-quinone oxidoreductase subunit A